MSILTYFIYTPSGDQSLVIAQFLRHYFPRAEVVGLLLPGEIVLSCRDCYSRIVPVDSYGSGVGRGIHIPTGAITTRHALEMGDLRLGSITLTQPALRVYDKSWMIAKASEVGVPAPVTWQDFDDVSKYPVFYKQKLEQGGGIRGIARKANDVPVLGRESLIFQEFIESQGTYGVCFLADQGRLFATNTHFERESIPKEGGSAVIIERFNDDRLLRHTKRLIDSLNYSGWGLAEFKYCPRRDDYVFMEINAKFWASCEFAFVNEPLFLKLLFDIESREIAVERMVFVDRALSRGLPFVLKHLPYLFRGTMLRAYSGWFKSMVAGVIPRNLRKPLKRRWIQKRKV